jgi:hypothetical protein
MAHVQPPLFTWQDAERAAEEWGCNCGPSAIAAITGLSLDEVRPHMGDFEKKRYTNPTLMWAALQSIGVRFSYRGGDLGKNSWPAHGLCRIQFEGPWTEPGVNPKWAYRQTHWVAASRHEGEIGVFDINAIGNGSGWCLLEHWVGEIVPWIIREAVPRANGGWHITHSVEIPRPLSPENTQEGGL